MITMRKRLFYPAVFHSADEGGYTVTFPDLPGCVTEGDTVEEAYEMAMDALGLYIIDDLDNDNVVPASEPSDIIVEADDRIILIEFDYLDYQKKHNSQSVKKTLSIPSWLNEEALKNNINFSNVLQEALMEKLSI